RLRFDRMGVFTYSHEENTHSYSMKDDVPEGVKQERQNTVMELQQGISFELNQARVGNTYKTLIDRTEDGHFIGRTEFDSPEVDNEVIIKSIEYLRIGDFTDVTIQEARDYDLIGTIDR